MLTYHSIPCELIIMFEYYSLVQFKNGLSAVVENSDLVIN